MKLNAQQSVVQIVVFVTIRLIFDNLCRLFISDLLNHPLTKFLWYILSDVLLWLSCNEIEVLAIFIHDILGSHIPPNGFVLVLFFQLLTLSRFFVVKSDWIVWQPASKHYLPIGVTLIFN
jgi:hypothetical protein